MSLTAATIPVFIPVVNRFDLLKKAVESVPIRLTTEPVIINNSGAPLPYDFHIYPVINVKHPKTFSETQNLMLEMAEARPFYFFMHSDAEDNEGILDRLFDMARLQVGPWGVIFTSYDALACYNTEAMKAIGGWDENLPWYRSDCDCYRRMRVAGYPTLESGLCVKHTPSQTINSDSAIKARADAESIAAREYYIRKWGGDNGHEVYEVPWGGRNDNETRLGCGKEHAETDF
jgi:hypothetical protein